MSALRGAYILIAIQCRGAHTPSPRIDGGRRGGGERLRMPINTTPCLGCLCSLPLGRRDYITSSGHRSGGGSAPRHRHLAAAGGSGGGLPTSTSSTRCSLQSTLPFPIGKQPRAIAGSHYSSRASRKTAQSRGTSCRAPRSTGISLLLVLCQYCPRTAANLAPCSGYA